MERLSKNGEFESKLWKVLEKEGLADLSQYHRLGFFDEVPLYSRSRDVSFLQALAIDHADSVLLSFALKFLKSLIAYEIPKQPLFAALTIWLDTAGTELVVPNLFACAGR